MTHRSRPLIEMAEGADQDNLHALMAAYLRVVRRRDNFRWYDLHVEQLLRYVFASDRDGRGVQKSYPQLGEILRAPKESVRKIVQVAEREFGLLAKIEDRYAAGGQAANRYSIEWPVVRAINAGLIEAKSPVERDAGPGVPMGQGGVPMGQGGGPMGHPLKECSLLLLDSLKDSSSTTSEHSPQVRPLGTTWKAVEEELLLLGVVKAAEACKAARDNGSTPDHVRALAQWWQRSLGQAPQRWRSPGYALYVRICNARPSLDVDAGWLGTTETPAAAVVAQPRASPLPAEEQFRCDLMNRLKASGLTGLELRQAFERGVEKRRMQQEATNMTS